MWPEATPPYATVSMDDVLTATGGSFTIVQGAGKEIKGEAHVMPDSLSGTFEGKFDGLVCFIGTENASHDTDLQNVCCATFASLR